MEFKEVIGRRRSIRYFVPYRPVERKKIQTILEAARLASCASLAGKPPTADPVRAAGVPGAPRHPRSILRLCWAIAGCHHRYLSTRHTRG